MFTTSIRVWDAPLYGRDMPLAHHRCTFNRGASRDLAKLWHTAALLLPAFDSVRLVLNGPNVNGAGDAWLCAELQVRL